MIHITEKMLLMLEKMALEKMHILSRRFDHYSSYSLYSNFWSLYSALFSNEVKICSKQNCCYRDVIVWAISNTLMLTLQISLEVWKRLKIVSVCMKRITGFYGSIKIGEQVWQKFEGRGG